jgi:hypothetical protein
MAADADFAGVEPASINPLETSVPDDGGGSPNVRRGALRLVEAITRQLADWPMVVVHGRRACGAITTSPGIGHHTHRISADNGFCGTTSR